MITPEPLTIVQRPVPSAGNAAAIVKVVPQSIWSGPALEVTGWLFITTTSSVTIQAPFVTVQRSVVCGVQKGTKLAPGIIVFVVLKGVCQYTWK